MAVSGDTALIAARGADDAGADSGAAYVFERDAGGAGTWGEVKKLTASDAAAGDGFGGFRGTALSGDIAVVVAPHNRSGRGAAYVFERDAGGVKNWGEVKKLTASDAAVGDGFGFSAAISGETVLVGAANDDDDGPARVRPTSSSATQEAWATGAR